VHTYLIKNVAHENTYWKDIDKNMSYCGYLHKKESAPLYYHEIDPLEYRVYAHA
jgi:hypothetical protein